MTADISERTLPEVRAEVRARASKRTRSGSPNQQQIIARAKQEWESAVDSVPELICLLDSKARIVRVNRSIERWGFAPLRAAIGANVHSVIHRHCNARSCGLARVLRDLSRRLDTAASASLHVEDAVLAKVLSLDMRAVGLSETVAGQSQRFTLLVVADVTELTQAQQSISHINEQLEQRVHVRTHELQHANEVLREEVGRRHKVEAALSLSRNQLSELSMQLMRAQEHERKKLAQELHDSVGQSLSATKYTLEHAVQLLSAADARQCEHRLLLAVAQVQKLIGEVRSISSDLRPTVLDDLGVASAVHGFCREWAQVYPHVELQLRIEIGDQDVPCALRTTVFRIVQEGLNNAAKHSEASRVSVAIKRNVDTLTLEIADDGRGFVTEPTGSAGWGMGLRGMRERAEHTGGCLHVDSAPGKGTRLGIVWLLPGPGARNEALS